MSGIASVLRDGVAALTIDLQDVALLAISELAPKWKVIALKLDHLSVDASLDSPEALLRFLAVTLNQPLVRQAFDELGFIDLYTKLNAVILTLTKPNNPYIKLISPVEAYTERYLHTKGDYEGWADGDNRGLVSLPLLKLNAKDTAKSGKVNFTFSMEANAELEIEAGAVWPFQKDEVPPGLVRLTLKGKLSGDAGAKLPFKQGSVSLNAGASAENRYYCYFRPDSGQTPFALAIPTAVVGVPNPFSLSSISNAIAQSGLAGLILTFDGSAQVEVELALGEMGEIPKFLSATAALKATVSVSRKANWVLSMRAGVPPQENPRDIYVVLSRNSASDRRFALGLDLEVDASPLAMRANEILLAAQGELGDVLNKIRPFLHPGSYLRNEFAARLGEIAKDTIGNDAVREALVSDLGLVLGTSAQDNLALAELLKQKILDAAGGVQGILSDAANNALKSIEVKLSDQLSDSVVMALSDGLRKLIEDANNKLKSEVERLVDKPTNLNKLVKELKELGIVVSTGVAKADAALAGVRTLINKYELFLQKLVEKTGDAAKAKLQAKIAWEVSRETRRHYEIKGRFTKINPETKRLYQAISMGKLEVLQRLFGSNTTHLGFTLDPDSSISRFASSTSKFGYDIILFGLKVSGSEISKGSAEIKLLGNGDVTVEGTAVATNSAQGLKEARSISFISSYSLLLAKLGKEDYQQQRNMVMSLDLNHDDEKLEYQEVRGFLLGLGTTGLIDDSRVQRALEIHQEWKVKQPDGHVGGKISIKLTLPSAALYNMVDLGRRIVEEEKSEDNSANQKKLRVRYEVFTAVCSLLREAGVISEDEFRKEIRDARNEPLFSLWGHIKDDQNFLYLIRREATGLNIMKQKRLGRLVECGNALLQMLSCMAKIYDAIPEDGDAFPAGWSEKKYRNAEKSLADSITPWLRLNRRLLFWFERGMHPITLTFLRLLFAFRYEPDEGELWTDLLTRPIDPATTTGLVEIGMTPLENEKLGTPVLIDG